MRLVRDGTVAWTGRIGSLRRFKDDVREVEAGLECGVVLEGFQDVKVGDVLEAFETSRSRRRWSSRSAAARAWGGPSRLWLGKGAGPCAPPQSKGG